LSKLLVSVWFVEIGSSAVPVARRVPDSRWSPIRALKPARIRIRTRWRSGVSGRKKVSSRSRVSPDQVNACVHFGTVPPTASCTAARCWSTCWRACPPISLRISCASLAVIIPFSTSLFRSTSISPAEAGPPNTTTNSSAASAA
jgi:hypothetical protein